MWNSFVRLLLLPHFCLCMPITFQSGLWSLLIFVASPQIDQFIVAHWVLVHACINAPFGESCNPARNLPFDQSFSEFTKYRHLTSVASGFETSGAAIVSFEYCFTYSKQLTEWWTFSNRILTTSLSLAHVYSLTHNCFQLKFYYFLHKPWQKPNGVGFRYMSCHESLVYSLYYLHWMSARLIPFLSSILQESSFGIYWCKLRSM